MLKVADIRKWCCQRWWTFADNGVHSPHTRLGPLHIPLLCCTAWNISEWPRYGKFLVRVGKAKKHVHVTASTLVIHKRQISNRKNAQIRCIMHNLYPKEINFRWTIIDVFRKEIRKHKEEDLTSEKPKLRLPIKSRLVFFDRYGYVDLCNLGLCDVCVQKNFMFLVLITLFESTFTALGITSDRNSQQIR